jgi:hypothetical protein
MVRSLARSASVYFGPGPAELGSGPGGLQPAWLFDDSGQARMLSCCNVGSSLTTGVPDELSVRLVAD